MQDALERLGYAVVGIDVGHDLVTRLREVAPDVAFVALHGRDGEDDIREGIRRIGEVVREQVALYGTLTGETRPDPARAAEEAGGADVVQMPARRQDERRARP